ncbi:MAG: LLM class F420-dependent oxidoreductase [Pseudomonadota bacterium]|nr:LLM class F420-dependent oxidoreductase [Pseudomonadota bacterium]
MKYGFSLVVRCTDATPEGFTAIAETAEALALDSLWCSAHIIVPPQVKSDYAMVPGRRYPDHWQERYWEPVTVLSYLAAKTDNLILGTSVTVLPMHNPFEVAKYAAEIDQLSGGRFVLGVGVGWFEEEFEILGQSFHNRGARTNEALRLMKALWGPDPVTFDGRYYPLATAHFAPKPVQEGGPPIWIAGASQAALKRTARYGDAWHPVRPSLEQVAQAREDLGRYLESFEREADSLEYAIKLPLVFNAECSGESPTHGTASDIIDGLKRYREAGADHFVFDLIPETVDTALETMHRFAEEVRPHLD